MNSHQNSFEDNFSSNFPKSSTNPSSRFSDHPPSMQVNSRSENVPLEEKSFSSTFNSHKTGWSFRNGRNGVIKSSYLHEDDVLFREHQEQMEKKQTYEFSNIKSVDLKVLHRGKEIVDTNEMKTFEDFPDLDNVMGDNLKKMKFSLMTPIQKAVMPYIFKGNDVMGCSHTGSGKTIAFLLPIITKMLREGPPADEQYDGMARPVALILIPTRELAEQIYKEARKLVHKTGITVVKVYGGVGQHVQIRDLSYGCDVLVATPGRLIDFVKQRRISFSSVKYLIIDEADRLLDMGFEPQLNNIVFDYDLRAKEKRLNLMFSATLEDDVKNIARKFMNDYYFIHTNTEVKASQNVTQMILFAKEEEKIIQLHQFLQKIKGSIIIFLDTKRGVENLCHFLEKSNYNVIAIHGDKKQFQRQEAIQKFTNGAIPILIATDVASRGLDFPKVSYVFNYDMPSNIDAYIHRIGRTGRGGDKGVAISFINDNSKNIVKSLFHLLKNQNQEIPDWFDRMYKNCGSYSSGGRDNNYNNRNKTDRDHNYLNRKRREDNNSGAVNSYSAYGGQPQNQSYQKSNGYNNGYSSEKPAYEYNKYGAGNNVPITTYPAANNAIASNVPNTFSNTIPIANNLPSTTTAPMNTNSFPYYQQPYNNFLPKFNYNNVGYYPGQNFNSLSAQSQIPSSQKPLETANDIKNDPPTLKFNNNTGESSDHPKRNESRELISSNQNEWMDLKDYADKNSSRDQIRKSDRDRERERDRERDRESDRSREYNRSRDYPRDRDRERDRDSHRDRERDIDSHRDSERDRDRGRERDRDSHSNRDRDRERYRERERSRDKERSRDHHRSSRENDHHRRSRPDDRYNK